MSNRRIESPDINSDIELAPSGTKRAKVSHSGGIIIGSNDNDASNVKLHRAAADRLEVVIGNDATPEGSSAPPANLVNLGMKGITVSEVAASESIIGTSSTASENIKLRRGGVGDLEVVTANESTAEGSPSYANRTNVQLGSVTVGSSTNPSENIKLHRAQAGMLEFIEGNNTASDGSEAVGVKSNIFVKGISIGSGTNGTGGKIFRSGPQELECSREDSVVVDGTRNPQYRAQINFKGSVVGSDVTESNNVKLHRGQFNELEITKGDDSTSENVRSVNKAQLNVKDLMVGADATLGNNAKLHRGASAELEVVVGSSFSTETDGTRSSSKAQLNVKSLSVGNANNEDHENNVKLHRGAVNELEVVNADDSTADNTRSSNKAQINVKDLFIGSDTGALSNNVKLHRSGSEEVEFLTGSANASTTDGTAYPADRAKLNVESLVVGRGLTTPVNAKLHRYLNTAYTIDETELEIVSADDSTGDGAMSSSGRRNLNVKGLSLGQSLTSSENAKLHRGGNSILEVVSGDDITDDGNPSSKKIQVNAKSFHIGLDLTDSDNVKFHRGADQVAQVVKGTDSTSDGTLSTDLAQMSFKFESYADGSRPSATSQDGRGIWNTTFKYLELSNGTSWTVVGENKNRHIIENVGFTAVANSNTMVVSLKNQEGNDPANGAAVRIAYRNATLTSGSWVFRTANAAQSLTISSGATLGTSNSLSGRVYVYLLDNAGSLELAVSQKYYDYDSVVNTTAISSSADNVDTVYSSSARTGVAIVNIGYFESTQTTAGTWVNNPTKIQVGDMGSKDVKAMTSATAGPGDVAVSSAVSQSLTAKATVTNLNVNLTTTGRPVKLQLLPGSPGGSSTTGYLTISQTGADYFVTGKVYLYRGSTEIAVFEFGKRESSGAVSGEALTISPSCIDFLDNAPAGIHNYNVSAEASSTSGLLNISNVKLVAYEL